MTNPETIEINGLKTIHKLCKFGAERNMEPCTFTDIVERMFSELESQNKSPWIDVKEKEPELGVTVLACWRNAPDVEPELGYMDVDVDTGIHYWEAWNDDEPPTHWMPIPKVTGIK